ncbi:MAG: hypothetical protein ABI844_15800 [Saprospiraceae bacterium]
MKRQVYLLFLFSTILFGCTSKTTELDCSTITGANFSTNGGKLEAIIQSKCASSKCHSAGGEGSVHWIIGTYEDEKIHFDHMLESIKSGEMPQAGSPPLTNSEKDLFDCWSQSGFPK